VITSEDREDIWQDFRENKQAGDHEEICQNVENEGLDIWPPLKWRKEITHRVRAGYVGAPGNLDSFGP
jgi:hypothetical protein